MPAKGEAVNTVRCLTIAGSDSGGGAGIQADLRAFAAQGCHGMSAIVAVTAQNTAGVSLIHDIPTQAIKAQIEAVTGDIGVDAAKTGMLGSVEVINAVADALENQDFPLVVDPVMRATSGPWLLRDDAVQALIERLFPRAAVITPNLPEAELLCGRAGSRRELAEELHELGAVAVIITGGHGDLAIDHLFDGRDHHEIPVPRHHTAATHAPGSPAATSW